MAWTPRLPISSGPTAFSFAVDDDALTATIRDGQAKIFSEDLAMLERQQQNLSRHPARRLLRLNIDVGGVRSRMLIQQAITQEGIEDAGDA
jgi:vanillate O-demethylase monooxygenase subunit